MLVEMTLLILASAVLIVVSALSRQLTWQRRELDKCSDRDKRFEHQLSVDVEESPKAISGPKLMLPAAKPVKKVRSRRRQL
jgi:hypothetical protein